MLFLLLLSLRQLQRSRLLPPLLRQLLVPLQLLPPATS
jgi:hypothetical protein